MRYLYRVGAVRHEDQSVPVAKIGNETVALSTVPIAKPMGTENESPVSGAVNAPAPASAAAVAIAPSPGKARQDTLKLALTDQPKPMLREDSVRPTPARIAPNRSAKVTVAEQTPSARASKVHVNSKTVARGKRDELRYASTHRYAPAHRPHGGYLDYPTYRTAGRDEPLTPGGRGTRERNEDRANGYLSPAEMYSMLAHSPVLDDDNSSSARTSSRQVAAPLKPITASRANSAGAAQWNAN
jgi:hypothetical protein